MDPRTAAHVLTRIGALLELQGVERFRARAYAQAADAVRDLAVDDITPLYRSGELGELHGVGPATLSVLGELVETGESSLLERLREETPESLLEVLRVPGLGGSKVALLHRELGITSLDDLEAAAQDGRLERVRGFGPKTVQRILRGIAIVRGEAGRLLYGEGVAEAMRVGAAISTHPDVLGVEMAGALRRVDSVIRHVSLAVRCAGDPDAIALDLGDLPGVVEREPLPSGALRLRFADEAEADVFCASDARFATVWWTATGNAEHVAQVTARAKERGVALDALDVADETALYAAAGLPWITPELREGLGEVAAAAEGELPQLIDYPDVRGVLHCHSTYSDGAASIAEMAAAARERGWSYIGITDHSAAAFYAGGLKPDAVRRQHEEIDRLNEELGGAFRILKGTEADILADGVLDVNPDLRDSFDYVIGSVHSRFTMDLETMTARVLTAMDDPLLTILAHPTGRLLLMREPYAIDLEAVIAKAAETGVVLEMNADPRRLDLDWRWARVARDAGVMIEIGPDAHSPAGLDNVRLGVKLARKAWVGPSQLLNAGAADDVLAYAARRRAGA